MAKTTYEKIAAQVAARSPQTTQAQQLAQINKQNNAAARGSTTVLTPTTSNVTTWVPTAVTAQRNAAQAQELERQAKMRYATTPTTQTQTTPTTQTQKVSYIDNNGNKQIGYADVVQNTQTQSQPVTETAPVAETEAAEEVSYWENMKGMYSKLYEEAVKANDAQAAAAAERAAAAADEQLTALGAQYADTNRQLYRDYMQTQKALPQQLAAQGYTGGASESARLRLGTTYQETLAQNERARIAAAAGIESEQAQTEYEIAAAAAEANRQALADQNAQLIALEQERYSYEQALKEARAQQMAAAGDFSGMLDLGYSQDDVDYLTRVWLLENPAALNTWIAAHPADAERLGISVPAATSSGGGGGGGGGTRYADYTNPNYTSLLGAAVDDVASGGSLAEVYANANAAAASGNISKNEADSIKSAAQTYASHVAQRQNAVTSKSTTSTGKGKQFVKNFVNALMNPY